MSQAVRMLVLACAMWGVSFPAIKALSLVQSAALPDASTWFLSTATMVARFSIGAVLAMLILIFLRGRLRFSASEFWQGLGLGVFGGGGMLFQVDGLAHTEASTSAFLTQATVFFIPLAKAIWQRRLPGAREVICCLLALAGIAVLAQFDWRQFQMGRGEAETLLAAVFFTGHIMCLEVRAFQGNDPLKVSVVMFAVISLICLPLLWLTGAGAGAAVASFASAPAGWFLAILVGPCTLLAFIWMNRWQPQVSATAAGLIYCFEPVFASVFALFLPGVFSGLAGICYQNETITLALLAGGGLILLANIIMTRAGRLDAVLNEHGV